MCEHCNEAQKEYGGSIARALTASMIEKTYNQVKVIRNEDAEEIAIVLSGVGVLIGAGQSALLLSFLDHLGEESCNESIKEFESKRVEDESRTIECAKKLSSAHSGGIDEAPPQKMRDGISESVLPDLSTVKVVNTSEASAQDLRATAEHLFHLANMRDSQTGQGGATN